MRGERVSFTRTMKRGALEALEKRLPVKRTFLLLLLIVCPAGLHAGDAPPLRWGGDAEGGAPFVEADANDPSKLRGFDVEVAEEIARGLGRTPHFVQVQFSSIDQSVARGDFDIGMSGVEDTVPRRAALAATIPYFEFHEVLTVRDADRDRFLTLADLRGRRVGTLGATVAYDRLLESEKNDGVIVVSYDDDVHPYEDLKQGRVDAVLLDNIIAVRSTHRVGGLTIQPVPVAKGHYIGVLASENGALRDRVNGILKARMRDGTLERIYRKWEIWDDDQAPFFAATLRDGGPAAVPVHPTAPAPRRPMSQIVLSYIPALLRASLITIVLSCASMALAVLL
ncbi:MAG: hypothetical protein JWO56_2528, partial [Acidobacteria bacterium]|nr:hypothetical protein [Acidobacteriota bacterium]